jgi:hypothetical protein
MDCAALTTGGSSSRAGSPPELAPTLPPALPLLRVPPPPAEVNEDPVVVPEGCLDPKLTVEAPLVVSLKSRVPGPGVLRKAPGTGRMGVIGFMAGGVGAVAVARWASSRARRATAAAREAPLSQPTAPPLLNCPAPILAAQSAGENVACREFGRGLDSSRAS